MTETGRKPRGRKRPEIGAIFQALADATRRQMMERVSRGPVTVSELARPFAMTLAASLQHVQALEACGLVKTEKQGRVRLVQMDSEGMAVLREWVTARRGVWEQRLDGLKDMLEGAGAKHEE